MKIPRNTVLFHRNNQLKSINEVLDVIPQLVLFKDFEKSVKKLKKLNPSIFNNEFNIYIR